MVGFGIPNDAQDATNQVVGFGIPNDDCNSKQDEDDASLELAKIIARRSCEPVSCARNSNSNSNSDLSGTSVTVTMDESFVGQASANNLLHNAGGATGKDLAGNTASCPATTAVLLQGHIQGQEPLLLYLEDYNMMGMNTNQ